MQLDGPTRALSEPVPAAEVLPCPTKYRQTIQDKDTVVITDHGAARSAFAKLPEHASKYGGSVLLGFPTNRVDQGARSSNRLV